jgi:pimeloyl-ACP methyl ester carboxylesterase
MRKPTLIALAAACLQWPPAALPAQNRSMAQDSTLDNLAHPAGTETTAMGTLGAVRRVGSGPRSMILIPGIGFSGSVYDEFMDRFKDRYTMLAVTLPGFGGTRPLPMPAAASSFGAIPWTRSAIAAVLGLMDRERIGRATLVAHWLLGSQVALRLALDHPDRFDAVVLIGGVAESYYSNVPPMLDWSLEQRIRYADQMGSRWFRTVTRKTWDDQNFMSFDYAIHPLRGLFLWREAAEPSLPVWIRYLLESYAQDPTPELASLKVPTLVVKPGFDDPGFFVDGKLDYMKSLTHDSWRNVEGRAGAIRFVTAPHARLFVMFDRPEELDRVVASFLTEDR